MEELKEFREMILSDASILKGRGERVAEDYARTLAEDLKEIIEKMED